MMCPTTLVGVGLLVFSLVTAGADWTRAHWIEALFLGGGPLRATHEGPGCMYFPGTMSGFGPGVIRVVLGASVAPRDARAVEHLVHLVDMATAGALEVLVAYSPELEPTPGQREVTVATVRRPSQHGCPTDEGCADAVWHPQLAGVMAGVRVLMPPGQSSRAYAHDTAHALLGLCHIDDLRIGGPEYSLMSYGRMTDSSEIAPTLTALDIAAIRAVYEAGLGPGATRADFVAAGLLTAPVPPPSGGVIGGTGGSPLGGGARGDTVRGGLRGGRR